MSPEFSSKPYNFTNVSSGMVAISLEPFINIKSYPYLYQVYIREALAIVA